MGNLKYEPVSEGHFFNRCTGVDENGEKTFETYSFWGKASDCEFEDGTNAEDKLGNIKGITASTDVTETGYVADASVVSDVYNRTQVNDVKFVFDYQNGKYGYNTDPNRGADTFFPFSEIERDRLLDALKYSGIDIGSDDSADEIYSTLTTLFGDCLRLFGYKRTSGVEIVTTETPIYPHHYTGEPTVYGDGTLSATTKISNGTTTFVTIAVSVLEITNNSEIFMYYNEPLNSSLLNQLNFSLWHLTPIETESCKIVCGLMNSIPEDDSWNDWKLSQELNYEDLKDIHHIYTDETGQYYPDETMPQSFSLDISNCNDNYYVGIKLVNTGVDVSEIVLT